MAVNYYIATDGDDQNDGITGDVATVAKALELIRAARTGSETEPYVCNIRSGIYDEALAVVVGDTGTDVAPLIIKGVSSTDRPVFSGSVALPSGGWSEVTGADLALFKPSAAGKVFEYDISGISGVVGFDQAASGSLTAKGNELFIDGQSALIARWPNDAWATTTTVDTVSDAPNIVLTSTGPTGQETVGFTGTPWVQGFWQYDWINLHQATLNTSGQEYTIADEHSYGYKTGARMSVTNSLYEVDQNFEYAINNDTLKLYVFLDNSNPAAYAMTLSTSADVLMSLHTASHVQVADIILREGRNSAVLLEYGGDVEFDNVHANGISNSAFKTRDGENYTLKNCTSDDIGSFLSMTVAGRTNLISCGHQITGNTVTNFGRHIVSTQSGMSIDSVGAVISGNYLEYGPSAAIRVIGNNNEISFNTIANFGMETEDVGGIYIGGDWYGRGNVFKFNTLYNEPGSWSTTADVSAIYLDDMASGTTVHDNTIHDVYRGILLGGGRDNDIQRNNITDTRWDIHMDGRGIKWEEDGTEATIVNRNIALRDTLLPDTTAEQRWYAAYPPLETLWADYYLAPEDNAISTNYTSGTGELIQTSQAIPYSDSSKWFSTMAVLDNPVNDEKAYGVVASCDSTVAEGAIYYLSKTTPFTGTEEEIRTEIIANGVRQDAGLTNEITVTGQPPATPHYAKWLQDSDYNPYGDDLVLEVTGTTFQLICGDAGYVFDAEVEWGDGSTDAIISWNQAELNCDYGSAGTRIIRVSGDFPWVKYLNNAEAAKINRILQLGQVATRNNDSAWYGAVNATQLTTGAHAPASAWSANAMLRNWDACVNPPDFTGFDTSQCINMTQFMFRWGSMTTAPDMSGFDMSNVTVVQYMMREWTSATDCDPKISGWSISSITGWLGFAQLTKFSTAAYDEIIRQWSTQTWNNTTNVDFGLSKYSSAVSSEYATLKTKIEQGGSYSLLDGGLDA